MLLAKSDPQLGLKQHTIDVLKALSGLREVWPEIPVSLDKAAIFHDLGKAATGFQKMLQESGERWSFRHEVLSAEIFRQCCGLENDGYFAAYTSILTHHKNLGSSYEVSEVFQRCCSRTHYGIWFGKWREFCDSFRQLRSELAELEPLLKSWEPNEAATSPANNVAQLIGKIQPAFVCRETAIARGALVAADHLASAGLYSTVLGQNISRDLLERYAREHIGNWERWSDFQMQTASRIGSTILVAPTGAGKTEAALLWAVANRRGFERIFYVLPYQVSINAMAARIGTVFPDDAHRAGISDNDNIAVVHSNTDLAYLQDARNDDVPPHEALAIARHKTGAARKIYSPIKIATVFQLLDVFFGRKFFEVGFLELTNSVVIFDEIHAYDGHTLGLIFVLLECLQKLGARVLIMTATLPTSLKSQLCDRAGIDISKEIVLSEDDPLLAEVRRTITADDRLMEEMVDDVRSSVLSGRKTAVVCNTVGKSIRVFEALADLKPLLLHSRFTFGHRSERESKKNIEEYQLVIATQVIEVSLDVSFEVMFTELAPVDGLLQRFGRVNRHWQGFDQTKRGVCHIACGKDPGSERVYSQKLLDDTRSHIPREPLTFDVSRQWIEAVYPNGLTAKGRMDAMVSEEAFRNVVEQLKPMLDSSVSLSTEATLFDSVQVIPLQFESIWQKMKQDKNHMEAKKLVVNVRTSSWKNALRQAASAKPRDCDGWTIAPFSYDPDRGLLLDSPVGG